MHKIQEKEFDRGDFSYEHLKKPSLDLLQETINLLNKYRLDFINPEAEKLGVKKDYWWQMIQLLPSSYNQTRNVMLNYEVLANIYKSRKNHKLDEWLEFCKWIEELPYSELIVGVYETIMTPNEQREKIELSPIKEPEMVNVYGQWIPKKDVANSSNYEKSVFNGECD